MEEMNKLLAKRWVFSAPQTQLLGRDLLLLGVQVQPLPSPRAHCHLGSAKQGTVSQAPLLQGPARSSKPSRVLSGSQPLLIWFPQLPRTSLAPSRGKFGDHLRDRFRGKRLIPHT